MISWSECLIRVRQKVNHLCIYCDICIIISSILVNADAEPETSIGIALHTLDISPRWLFGQSEDPRSVFCFVGLSVGVHPGRQRGPYAPTDPNTAYEEVLRAISNPRLHMVFRHR